MDYVPAIIVYDCHQKHIRSPSFVTPMGKFKFMKVHFGLSQSPAHFQQFIKKVLQGQCFTISCFDDILIYSST